MERISGILISNKQLAMKSNARAGEVETSPFTITEEIVFIFIRMVYLLILIYSNGGPLFQWYLLSKSNTEYNLATEIYNFSSKF